MLNRENSHFQLSSQFHSGNDTLRGLTRSQTRGGPSRLALRATASRGCGLDRPPPLRPGGLHALKASLEHQGSGYRSDHLRALAQRVEVDQKELRIMGSKSVLPRTLVADESAKTAGSGVPSSVPKWRTRHDSNV
jgi:hypothetical protein